MFSWRRTLETRRVAPVGVGNDPQGVVHGHSVGESHDVVGDAVVVLGYELDNDPPEW